MAEVLIIGYGNPLRGDDGAGWQAAEMLKDRIRDERVEIVRSHQLTPEMAEAISRARKVIFIDADCDNREGQIAIRNVVPEHGSEVCTHQLTPGVLLGAARKLYGGSAEGMLVTMGAGSFEYGSELSEAVRTALPLLVERVREMCGEWLSAAGNSYHL
ncbi:MAG TPA: hydrogenase maturation protease [Bryobacteraceae bacterium]|nr:hydrogenase maturation protease [Bryobacteraceae bacterium]HOL72432.1 hydrogenase maturation protease [Bryobacteraceae bacterium]HOQ44847.1 hydrogenase maturation protease [Bryobacteraceae bacterium]HPQ15938.1 hydrogenase maturation protease [Bryobacteraceae bacterium]HPU72142.1 hydrogenase maturation protease [Bryobacteraceae bacterium]